MRVHTCSCTCCTSCMCRVRALCHAVRCVAPRRVLRLPHTSLDCEPRRPGVRLRGVCTWRARVRTSAVRSRRVCCDACGDTLLFPRVRRLRVGVPQRSTATAAPQPEGSTRSHRGRAPHTPTHHTVSVVPLPPTFPEERATKDPGAPLLSAVCVSPSPQQPPGYGAAKNRKTQEPPARKKNTCGERLAIRADTHEKSLATADAHDPLRFDV